MSLMERIARAFDAFAKAVVDGIEAEAIEVAEEVAESVADGFAGVVDRVGAAATKFVHDLFGDGGVVDGRALSGLEKANLAVAQLTEHAAANGIELLAHDATAIVKNAFLAVKDRLEAAK